MYLPRTRGCWHGLLSVYLVTLMPLIDHHFQPPVWAGNRHIQTIYPALFRRVHGIAYTRERIFTPDHDFLDLDWVKIGGSHLVILAHGLEGSAKGGYMLGMAKALHRKGCDTVSLNFRGCSGEPNWQFRSYHSGETGDLHTVIGHIVANYAYQQISLVGFSLGGNVVLKYAGEQGAGIHPAIRLVVGISVPCDLATACANIGWVYAQRFLRSLKPKARQKFAAHRPELIGEVKKIRKLKDFDDVYTGPAHGFRDADDYYTRCSSRQFLPGIRVPSLLLSALDDPFLGEACFPFEEARHHSHFYFLPTPKGGHVGFTPLKQGATYWSEEVVSTFVVEGAGVFE